MVERFSHTVRLVIIFLLCSLLTDCRKDDTIVISGLLTDPNQGIPVESAGVELWTQKVGGGIFTANYVLAGASITGADGMFSYEIKEENYTGIKLKFKKEGYFGWEADLNLGAVKTDSGSHQGYQLLPKATLRIHVKNVTPFSIDDYFDFRILNGYNTCEECCKSEKYQFTGMDIDQVIECQSAGHQDILIQWSERKNGEQIIHTGTYFVPAFETTLIELNY